MEKSTSTKYKLLLRKTYHGFKLEMFYRKGNGLKTLLSRVGRFLDFEGIYAIVNTNNQIVAISESESILRDVQNLARGTRKKDERLLEAISSKLGYKTSLAAQEYLRGMRVCWLEIINKSERDVFLKKVRNQEPVYSY